MSMGLYISFYAFEDPFQLTNEAIFISLATAFLFNPLSLIVLISWQTLAPGLRLFTGLFIATCLFIGSLLITSLLLNYLDPSYELLAILPFLSYLLFIVTIGTYLFIKTLEQTQGFSESLLAYLGLLLSIGLIASFMLFMEIPLFSAQIAHKVFLVSFLILPLMAACMIPWKKTSFPTVLTLSLILSSLIFSEVRLLYFLLF